MHLADLRLKIPGERNMCLGRDIIADADRLDRLAFFDHFSGNLMPQNLRQCLGAYSF